MTQDKNKKEDVILLGGLTIISSILLTKASVASFFMKFVGHMALGVLVAASKLSGNLERKTALNTRVEVVNIRLPRLLALSLKRRGRPSLSGYVRLPL